MIVPVTTGGKERLALVFDNVLDVKDFISYRDALLSVVKEMELHNDGSFGQKLFWLLQMAEYIDKSIDEALTNKNNN